MAFFIPIIAAGAALFTGAKMVGKLFGSDPDFTQAWMMNRMSGRGGFFKTFFHDGMRSMFLGSRTMSAAMDTGFGYGMYNHFGMNPGMNPYMANPYLMGGQMPYSPMSMFGPMMWGC